MSSGGSALAGGPNAAGEWHPPSAGAADMAVDGRMKVHLAQLTGRAVGPDLPDDRITIQRHMKSSWYFVLLVRGRRPQRRPA
jgi:hypothetical protein